MKSFYRKMAEEKGIINDIFSVEIDGMAHYFTVEQIIELIEIATDHEQEIIKDTFSKIDFLNGDLMHYIKFLATSYLKSHFYQY